MPQYCFVAGCSNINGFRFPKDVQLRKKWAKAVGKKPYMQSIVCDKHFKPEDFHKPVHSMVEIGGRSKRMLKPGVVPTVARWTTKKGSSSVINHAESANHPCAVTNCSGQGEFRFPDDADLLARWELAVRNSHPKDKKRRTYICAHHFLEHDIIQDGTVSGYTADGEPKKMLRPWAVPVLHLRGFTLEDDSLNAGGDDADGGFELGEAAFIMFKEKPKLPRPYSCPLCPTEHTSLSGLKQHMFCVHEFSGQCHPCRLCHCVMTTFNSWLAHYPKCPW
jgi:hypothetical protein